MRTELSNTCDIDLRSGNLIESESDKQLVSMTPNLNVNIRLSLKIPDSSLLSLTIQQKRIHLHIIVFGHKVSKQ